MPHDFGLVKDYFQQDILVDTALIQFTQEIDSAEVAGDFNQWEKVKVQLHWVERHCCTTGSPVPAMWGWRKCLVDNFGGGSVRRCSCIELSFCLRFCQGAMATNSLLMASGKTHQVWRILSFFPVCRISVLGIWLWVYFLTTGAEVEEDDAGTSLQMSRPR